MPGIPSATGNVRAVVGDQDLGVFFSDFATPVTVAGGGSFNATFDIPEKIESYSRTGAMASEVAGRPQIRFATAAVPPGFGHGTLLTIKGVQWKVRGAPIAEGDGQISVADLSKA